MARYKARDLFRWFANQDDREKWEEEIQKAVERRFGDQWQVFVVPSSTRRVPPWRAKNKQHRLVFNSVRLQDVLGSIFMWEEFGVTPQQLIAEEGEARPKRPAPRKKNTSSVRESLNKRSDKTTQAPSQPLVVRDLVRAREEETGSMYYKGADNRWYANPRIALETFNEYDDDDD